MMYSDYYAISTCAFSVVCIPFMVMAIFGCTHALQAFNYENRKYFRWIGCSFVASYLPLFFLAALQLVEEYALQTYLTHTWFDELQIIIGYAAWLLVACIVLALGCYRYAKGMLHSMWNVPRIADRRFVVLFTASSLGLAGVAALCNIVQARGVLYFIPLLVPLLAPFVNLFLRPYPGRVRVLGAEGGEWEEQEI